MRIEFLCKNYRLDEGLKELMTKKLNKFDKYFDDEASAKIKLSTVGKDKKDKYCMEISIDSHNMSLIRSIVFNEEMNENIDDILPKLEKQIMKHRTKLDKKLRQSAFDSPVIYSENEDIKDTSDVKIVKVKKFFMSVTSVENAIEEMEILGHNFYVFLNGDTNTICVVYKRNDGDYGLIEPEK